MRWFALFLLLTGVACAQSQVPSPQQNNAGNAPSQAQSNQRGTEQSPVLVKTSEAPKTPEETRQDAKGREDRAQLERETMLLSVLTLLVLALQMGAFVYQGVKLRQTVTAVADQAADMKQSVAEAARAATAMETVGEHIGRSAQAAIDSVELTRQRWAQQMRAYVTVIVNQAVYQDRANNIRFGIMPMMANHGHTLAHNVRYKATAEILPFPLPEHIALNLPPNLPWVAGAVLGPQQNFVMNATVHDFVPHPEVQSIMAGQNRRVYIWGTIAYRDQFGDEHETDFSQSVVWLPDGRIFGMYHRRNRAT